MEWATWGDQEALDAKMAETKVDRDAARETHEAEERKRREGLATTPSSTPHETERQEKIFNGKEGWFVAWFVAGTIERHTSPSYTTCLHHRH